MRIQLLLRVEHLTLIDRSLYFQFFSSVEEEKSPVEPLRKINNIERQYQSIKYESIEENALFMHYFVIRYAQAM